MADPRPASTLPPIDHRTLGNVVPLHDYVKDLRNRASDAAWRGCHTTAVRLDREADEASARGEDPVLMF